MPEFPSITPAVQVLQNIMDQDSQIRERNSNTQLLNIKSMLGQQEIIGQQKHQQAVEEYIRSERIADAQGGPINQNNPMAPAVAGQPPSWWTPVDQSVKDLTVERNKFERQMSKATNLGLTDEVKTLRPLFDNTVTRLREASKEQATQRETQFKQTAQMLNSAKTAEQITTAMDYIKDKMPPEVWKKSDSMLLHNPDGSYLWNDQQAQRVATLGSMHTTVAEQNTDKYHDAVLAGQAENRDREIARDAETVRYHNILAAHKQHGVAGGVGDAGGYGNTYEKLTDRQKSAVDWYATMQLGGDSSWRTGLARTKAGSDLIKAVDERVPERAMELGLSPGEVGTNKAIRVSAQAALTQNTKDIAMLKPYVAMLDQNADILKNLSTKAIATNSSLANRPLNWLRTNASDNPNVAEYLAQVEIVKNEATRVISNPRLVGQMTDTARHEIESIINGTMPLKATARVIDRIKNDGERRISTAETQQELLQKQIRERYPDLATAEKPSVSVKPESGAIPTGIPAGAKLIGKTPDGKKNVYETPDKKRWIE